MSYINNALRKAQKDRDSSYASYGDIISMRRDTAKRACWRLRAFIFPAAALVIVVVIAIQAWFLYKKKLGTPVVAVAVSQEAVAKPAAAAAARQEDSRGRQLYRAAVEAQLSKQWEAAERLYKQVLSLDQRHVHTLNNLGVLFMAQKRYDEATELFVKAIAVQEDYVDPYYNLACLYAQLDNFRASLDYLKRAVKLDGKVREWAKDEMDLKKLRTMPEFKKIIEELVE